MAKTNFPPSAKREGDIAISLDVLASVVQGRDAVYLSAPITSGKRFSIWYKENGKHLDGNELDYRDGHFREVIEPNRLHAKEIVRKMRRKFDSVLIDPTAVEDLPGWTQDDYRCFWARVIERYVHTVVFMDGWHYSLGCSYEFLTALKSGAVVLDEELQPLSLDDGIKLLKVAIDDLNTHKESSYFLVNVAESLKDMKVVIQDVR